LCAWSSQEMALSTESAYECRQSLSRAMLVVKLLAFHCLAFHLT
jgi:hypothetical protein